MALVPSIILLGLLYTAVYYTILQHMLHTCIAPHRLLLPAHYFVFCNTAAYAAYMHSTTVLVPTVHYCVPGYTAPYTAYMHSLAVLMPTVHPCVLCYTAAYAAYLQSTTVRVPNVHYSSTVLVLTAN